MCKSSSSEYSGKRKKSQKAKKLWKKERREKMKSKYSHMNDFPDENNYCQDFRAGLSEGIYDGSKYGFRDSTKGKPYNKNLRRSFANESIAFYNGYIKVYNKEYHSAFEKGLDLLYQENLNNATKKGYNDGYDNLGYHNIFCSSELKNAYKQAYDIGADDANFFSSW